MRFVAAIAILAVLAGPLANAQAPAADGAAGPPLEAWIASALEKSPARSLSRAALLEAEANRLERGSRLLPVISAQATRTFNEREAIVDFDGPGGNDPLVFTKKIQDDAVLTGRMPLFDLDAFARWRAGRAGARAAEADDRSNEVDTALNVARAYYTAVAASQVVRAAERAKATAEENKRIVEARLAIGATTQLLVQRADVELSRAEQVLIDAQRLWQSSRRALATLSGMPEPDVLSAPPPNADPPPPEATLLEAALASRPELAAARERATEASRGRLAAWGSFAPRVSATGTERYTEAAGFAGEELSWQVALTADWTLLDGGTRSAEVKRQRAAIKRTRAQLTDAENLARDELHNAWLDVDAARAKVAAARRGDTVARAAAEETRTRFKAGTVTQLDVIQSDRDALQAEVDRIRAEGELSIARLALRRAAGEPLPGR